MTYKVSIEITGDSKDAQAALEDLSKKLKDTDRDFARQGKAAQGAANENKKAREGFRASTDELKKMPGPAGAAAGRLDGLGAAARGIVSPLGLAATAAGALTLAMVRGVPAFANYERQMLRFEGVLRATSSASAQTVGDIERMSREVGRATLASTQQVRDAAAQLATFRAVTHENFERTLKSAQDLAELGFGSITSATQQLAKALEDPETGLTMLRRAGISFAPAQREVIKSLIDTGREAEALDMILARVEGQSKDTARAAAGGLAGAFDTLGEEMKLFTELAGGGVARVLLLRDAVNFLADAMGVLNAAIEGPNRARLFSEEQATAALDRLKAERDALMDVARSPFAVKQHDATITRLRQLDREIAVVEERLAGLDRAGRQAQIAATQGAADKFLGELNRQQREREALGRTELEALQAEARARAGLAPGSGDAAFIDAEVARTYEATQAKERRAAAEKEAAAAAAAGRKSVESLIAAQRQELAILAESDPVKQEMIRLAGQLAAATADERKEIEANIVKRKELNDALIANEERKRAIAAADDLVASLRDELAILQAMDPVQREMIRHRETLAAATGDQAAQIEKLVGSIEAERAAQAAAEEARREAQRSYEELGRAAVGALDAMIVRGERAGEVMKRLAVELAAAAIQGALLGQGPFGSLLGGGLFGGTAFGSVGAGGAIAGTGLRIPGLQRGGFVSGPGTATSDSIPARLSDGEFVVNAAATKKHRALLEAINDNAAPGFARGGYASRLPAFARGGAVEARAIDGFNHRAGAITVNVAGARGNREIMEMVEAGVRRGVGEYDARMPLRFREIASDPRAL